MKSTEPEDVSVEEAIQETLCGMADDDPSRDVTLSQFKTSLIGRLEARVSELEHALLSERRKGREEGLEEAASTAEHLNGWGSDCGRGGHAEHIAKVIRSLKDKQP